MWSALVPGGVLAWRQRRRALRELDDFQRLDQSILGLDEANPVNRAKVALESGDTRAALQFWQEAVARYPGFARGSRDALTILLGLRLFDEAEALMREGQRRAPRDPYYVDGLARLAERRGDNQEAIRRWERLRKKFPGVVSGYVRGAACLEGASQLDAAEALVEKAVRRFPDELVAWIQWASAAEHRRDWPEALRRWQTAGERFRNDRIDLGIAKALEELGLIAEAETRLRELQRRAPLLPAIVISLARLAHLGGDKEEAVRCWADARRRLPLLPDGYREGIRLLLEMDRPADAETILLTAIDRFPTEVWPRVEYAELATTQQDWPAAEARWAAVRAAWPDRQDGYLRAAEALTALGRRDDAAQLRAEHRHKFVP
jgi:tetratricopeptide (TPR) repeat protein